MEEILMEITEDLKRARAAKGLTQTEMAEKLELSLRMYQRIEEGKFPKYKTDQIRKIDAILGTTLYERIYEQNRHIITEHDAPEEEYLNKRRKHKSTSEPFMVPLVPFSAQAGYVTAYDQIQFLDTLEKYALPPGINPKGAEWRYFEVSGDSMEPTFRNGDIILASMVPPEDWQALRNFYTYVILTEKQLLIKRIFRKYPHKWVLISDNEDHYDQVYLEVDQIKELWVFRRHIDPNAPVPKKFEIKI